MSFECVHSSPAVTRGPVVGCTIGGYYIHTSKAVHRCLFGPGVSQTTTVNRIQ